MYIIFIFEICTSEQHSSATSLGTLCNYTVLSVIDTASQPTHQTTKINEVIIKNKNFLKKNSPPKSPKYTKKIMKRQMRYITYISKLKEY